MYVENDKLNKHLKANKSFKIYFPIIYYLISSLHSIVAFIITLCSYFWKSMSTPKFRQELYINSEMNHPVFIIEPRGFLLSNFVFMFTPIMDISMHTLYNSSI